MSWSLDVFSPRAAQVAPHELREHLLRNSPLDVTRLDEDAAETTDRVLDAQNEGGAAPWKTLSLRASGDALLPDGTALGRIHAVAFDAECEADPQLLPLFEADIAASDAADGDLDEEYSKALRAMLHATRWHYTLAVRRNGQPEQERAVVRAAHLLSQLAGGLVHDPQSGAWMDAPLFESLLDAYDVTDFSSI